MKLTFLGTGTSTGVPSIGCECETCTSSDPRDKRLRVSVLIEHAGQSVLIDTSSDFRQQALRYGLKRLDAVREALDVPRSKIRHGEFTTPVDDAQLSFEDLTVLT